MNIPGSRLSVESPKPTFAVLFVDIAPWSGRSQVRRAMFVNAASGQEGDPGKLLQNCVSPGFSINSKALVDLRVTISEESMDVSGEP